jgi:hypothetical protein
MQNMNHPIYSGYVQPYYSFLTGEYFIQPIYLLPQMFCVSDPVMNNKYNDQVKEYPKIMHSNKPNNIVEKCKYCRASNHTVYKCPSRRKQMCEKCFKFGHLTAHCKSKPFCFLCNSHDHMFNTCDASKQKWIDDTNDMLAKKIKPYHILHKLKYWYCVITEAVLHKEKYGINQ